MRISGFLREVGLSLLLLGVCRLFFLHDLQSLDHLEGEAHYAALLALVLDVDCLVVAVVEDLLDKPAVVVEALSPIWDGLVLHPVSLFAHRRLLVPSTIFFYPEEAPCILQKGVLEPICTEVPEREVSEVGRLSLLSDYGDRAMSVPDYRIRDTAHQSPP